MPQNATANKIAWFRFAGAVEFDYIAGFGDTNWGLLENHAQLGHMFRGCNKETVEQFDQHIERRRCSYQDVKRLRNFMDNLHFNQTYFQYVLLRFTCITLPQGVAFPPLKKQSKMAAVTWFFSKFNKLCFFGMARQLKAIPSESRKTDKVILDRTYFATSPQYIGSGV